MRVVVGGLAALGQKTGIGHYTTQLLRCLREQTEPGVIEAFPQGLVGRLRSAAASARPRLEARAAPTTGAIQRTVAALRRAAVDGLRRAGRAFIAAYFRSVCARQRYDLYHEPNFIPLPSDCQTVTTICDLSVLLHPEWHPADRVSHFERNFHRSLTRSTHFIAISDWGRQEIIDTLNISPARITRTYMGIRPGLAPLAPEIVRPVLKQLGVPERYLLYLGTIEPRKNVLLLLRAYCSLPSALRYQWPLVLAGGWGWNTAEVADYFHTEARHRGVIHLGYVPDEHIPALYNGARALVYPSLYEGFGLPPLEMMACGGAVLASTAGSLVELLGNHLPLLEPNDLDAWRSGLQRVLTDEDWWQHLKRRAPEVAQPYTWDQCAADTLRVYQAVCGERRESPFPTRQAA